MAESGCLRDMQVQNLEVAGQLNVTGATRTTGPTINTTAATAAFTAAVNTTRLLGDTGAETVVIAVPSPVVGAVIKFILVADLNDDGQWTIGTTGSDADFAIGSKLISASATVIDGSSVPHHGAVALGAHGFNVLTIVGDTNGGGGIGSSVTLTGVNEGGTNRWLVDAFLCGQGSGAVADGSAFA
tara:strand:+ start:71 stop:625 length:555 start_codon:yes stop_codon:yes gene_type:complete